MRSISAPREVNALPAMQFLEIPSLPQDEDDEMNEADQEEENQMEQEMLDRSFRQSLSGSGAARAEEEHEHDKGTLLAKMEQMTKSIEQSGGAELGSSVEDPDHFVETKDVGGLLAFCNRSA